MTISDMIDRSIWLHQYDLALELARDLVGSDIAIAALAARALRAKGDYLEALPLLERVDAVERANPAAPGHPGQRIEIACLRWMIGEQESAVGAMKGLVDGVLSRSVNYGDLGGALSQGLLLYYMATTTRDPENAQYALQYLKKRAKRSAIEAWPGPVARYYLHEVDLDFVLMAATGQAALGRAMESAETNLRKRRDLCVALFHVGARHRAEGNEAQCVETMRLCYSLEDPIIENEWYLARFEVARSGT